MTRKKREQPEGKVEPRGSLFYLCGCFRRRKGGYFYIKWRDPGERDSKERKIFSQARSLRINRQKMGYTGRRRLGHPGCWIRKEGKNRFKHRKI